MVDSCLNYRHFFVIFDFEFQFAGWEAGSAEFPAVLLSRFRTCVRTQDFPQTDEYSLAISICTGGTVHRGVGTTYFQMTENVRRSGMAW